MNISDEDVIADLKQFIVATVSQATVDMATKDDIASMATKDDIASMATKGDITSLHNEMHAGFAEIQSAIADTLTVSNDDTSNQLADHERRLSRLEHKAA